MSFLFFSIYNLVEISKGISNNFKILYVTTYTFKCNDLDGHSPLDPHPVN